VPRTSGRLTSPSSNATATCFPIFGIEFGFPLDSTTDAQRDWLATVGTFTSTREAPLGSTLSVTVPRTMIKDAVPPSLLIDGQHNPVTLLHDSLSKGLHAQSDEENLDLATHVRAVLADLVERVASALKDDSELKSSIAKLRQKAAHSSNRSEEPETNNGG